MPFTLAHVAAVLPLLHARKTRFSATGLIAGSVAPDFEKFLCMSLHNAHSHTWASLLYFSCPVGLGLSLLFHLVVRDALLAHVPGWLAVRLRAGPRVAWVPYLRRHYGVVLLSLLLGAATHLVWDGFTHQKGFLVAYFPALLTRVRLLAFHLPVYAILAIVSSVGGVVQVGRSLLRPAGARPATPGPGSGFPYWTLVLAAAGLLFAARQLWAAQPPNFWNVSISGVSAFLFGVAVASAIRALNIRRKIALK